MHKAQTSFDEENQKTPSLYIKRRMEIQRDAGYGYVGPRTRTTDSLRDEGCKPPMPLRVCTYIHLTLTAAYVNYRSSLPRLNEAALALGV